MAVDSAKLIEHLSKAWEISEESQNALLTETANQRTSAFPSIPQGSLPIALGISKVSTFIAKKSLLNFVVPALASHWGVVCDFSPISRVLYHLTFDPGSRKVHFNYLKWDTAWEKYQVVQIGTTLYGHPEIDATGTCHFSLTIRPNCAYRRGNTSLRI
jgi:hypothetical protein